MRLWHVFIYIIFAPPIIIHATDVNNLPCCWLLCVTSDTQSQFNLPHYIHHKLPSDNGQPDRRQHLTTTVPTPRRIIHRHSCLCLLLAPSKCAGHWRDLISANPAECVVPDRAESPSLFVFSLENCRTQQPRKLLWYLLQSPQHSAHQRKAYKNVIINVCVCRSFFAHLASIPHHTNEA